MWGVSPSEIFIHRKLPPITCDKSSLTHPIMHTPQACEHSRSFDYTQRIKLVGLTQALLQNICEFTVTILRPNQTIRKVSNGKAQP